MKEHMTLRERLLIALLHSVISVKTYLFFIIEYHKQLYKRIFKN